MQTELIQLARDAARKYNLPPEIICGLCDRESTWNPWLTRYEPGFERTYGVEVTKQAEKFVKQVKFTVTLATEIKERCISWGLGQVMGQVARERGFIGPLAQLCDPQEGLEICCKHLAAYLKIAQLSGGDMRNALLHYNGGGDPAYPDKVLALAAKYTLAPVQSEGFGIAEE